MIKISKAYFTVILILIITTSSRSQPTQHPIINEIPLEAFEEFVQDSFTLPGDSGAQAVYKYGVYNSKITIDLDEVGKVYVHHLLSSSVEGYSYTEIYSIKSSSGFIRGIKRFGNFRMYENWGPAYDTAYHGSPKVEIVRGINSIIRTIYPLSIFEIDGDNDMEIIALSNNDINTVTVKIEDVSKFVDTFLLREPNNVPSGGEYDPPGWIQYDLEDDLIKIDLYLHLVGEFIPGAFESVIYDSLGNQIGRMMDYGALNMITLTDDHRYVYSNCGGALTEDYEAPYIFRIYDLKTGEILFFKRSISNQVVGWSIPNSNLGVYEVREYSYSSSFMEAYVIDHDKNAIYSIHSNTLCKPPVYLYFHPTYCVCHFEYGPNSTLYYDKDFTSSIFKN